MKSCTTSSWSQGWRLGWTLCPTGITPLSRPAVERLAQFGDRMPYGHARDLGDGLWELRFDIAHHSVRLTYWLAEDRRAVLLTAFYKTRDRQPRDVERPQGDGRVHGWWLGARRRASDLRGKELEGWPGITSGRRSRPSGLPVRR
ncbi:type II toxin-antitoxin system RelE/ParE family toxin [Nonomuraea solani]|uniref:type II toxin-antitoxin system RelE/ParE family toxin n=1 Tax=Nonomuraea solani TaxID=1144553 RepID=UPI000CDE82C0